MISSILRLRSRVSKSPMVVILSAFSSAIDFDSIVAQCISVFEVHETQTRRTFDGARIEQDSWHLGFPVHFVQEHRYVKNSRRHRCHAGQKDEGVLRTNRHESLCE